MRGEDLAQGLPPSAAQPPLLQEPLKAEAGYVLEQLALPLACTSPGVVVNAHGEDRDADREGVCGEGVHWHVPHVDLWGLVGSLAADLVGDDTVRGRHPEVNELHLGIRAGTALQQDVLQGDVAVRDAQLVQPSGRGEDLGGQRAHVRLARWAGLRHGGVVAPREQVALRAEFRRHEHFGRIPVNAVELADVGEAHCGEALDARYVIPRLLGGTGVLTIELLRRRADPANRHALDGHGLVDLRVLHKLDAPLVPLCLLQVLH
mmetsp:Transcript_42317/g.122849  ORF Transcript_42317/g.122849 Transcript_42317/m.122849 type:complete len:262 (-) Transcript_42317:354-1139(-)